MKLVFYMLAVLSAIFTVSVVYSLFVYEDFRLLDAAAVVVFVWLASIVKRWKS
ncbi:hypothetical protein [Salimicrobium flavidum]|uniref:Uncharacterized protein n=1 Tax=Salimicrobium flavidum TaxID=570947 RepID=A0A1N7J8J5_9BACI|nr:hypothetical protein [Salimicrobium flavidum]SIS45685.1 hypothetical protein SAMN05421687_104152 [Salimicrobium flavidum]